MIITIIAIIIIDIIIDVIIAIVDVNIIITVIISLAVTFVIDDIIFVNIYSSQYHGVIARKQASPTKLRSRGLSWSFVVRSLLLFSANFHNFRSVVFVPQWVAMLFFGRISEASEEG